MLKTAKQPISEFMAEWEERNNRPINIYCAYPSIGRGSIIHNWIPNAEVEKRFAKALRIPFLKRLQWFIEGGMPRG